MQIREDTEGKGYREGRIHIGADTDENIRVERIQIGENTYMSRYR